MERREYTELFQREHNTIDYYDQIYIHHKRQFLTRYDVAVISNLAVWERHEQINVIVTLVMTAHFKKKEVMM